MSRPLSNPVTIFWTSLALLSGCASLSKPEFSTSLYVTASRHLELEPCGCSYNPAGGLVNEWNYMQQAKKTAGTTLILSGGTTFYPATPADRVPIEFYKKKAEFLLEGLTALGVEAIAISEEDLYFTPEELSGLYDKFGITFVASNISLHGHKKSPLKKFYSKNVAGSDVIVLGVSNPTQKSLKDWKVEPPISALQQLLSEIDVKGKFIILLSQLPRKQSLDLLSTLPIHLLVLTAEGESTNTINQWSRNKMWIGVQSRGRSVARIDLDPRGSFEKFFGGGITSGFDWLRQSALDQLEAKRSDIQNPKFTVQARKRLRLQLKEDEAFIERTKDLPTAQDTAAVQFRATQTHLDKTWATATNPMSDLVERYKKTIQIDAENGAF